MKMKGKTWIANKINRLSIILLIICIVIVIGIFLFPLNERESTQIDLSESSSVNNICELATLKSYYHNVVVYEKEPDGGDRFVNDVLFWPFGSYTKVGYKQYWIEYSGIVKIGIDANQIEIFGPDTQGVVEIFVPDAEIQEVSTDENSFTEPLTENGWFTTITTKEKTDAYAAAQINMHQEAENDEGLFIRAKENAKLLLEQYVINTGKAVGLNLSVKWIENP